MERVLTVIGLFVAGAIFQVGVAPYIAIGGISPNFFVLVVVVAGMTKGSNSGATLGFFAGLLLDLIGAGMVGPWAMVLSIAGYVTGLIDQHLFAEGGLLPITALAVISVLSEFLHLIISVVFGVETSFMRALFVHALPTSLYTTLVAILFFPVVARVMRSDTHVKIFDRIG